MPVVTALRPVRERVAVELDGLRWRTLPIDAVVEAGLVAGIELDRERARVLARAVRRHRAEALALSALARRGHSRVTLDARLARAGVHSDDRRAVVQRAERSRLVDDVRFAEQRAALLADRGSGDALILDDLARSGIDVGTARDAIDGLEPEHVRAAEIAARRGKSLRTARYLASRGFSDETVEELVADCES
jgi:regulatory protein